ncbi:acyl-CoA--6-aminopenicillanic acid acyltransferase [Bradyrhizobium rifense]|uniref:Acyl-CoA--6-aminopenicillanic acid acyltransferase n=1 Tax=Bradyrhizobium rifense TaxID=515499 RepID=A0A5D3KI51_9BRAD|nr:C45 family peptidase [Bradyrhizobium rifense]TYL94740.1 acyl-CoA--6-aminopenicillanic acid acyltransferase [Bradyrhizobium rifense]
MVEPFPLIEISGPPRERGRQYGQKAVARIKKGTSHYFTQLKELSLDAKGVAALVRDYLPVIEAFEPNYIEEMRGIAEGADVPFEDIVLLNARTEIIKLANPAIRARLKTPEDPDGCTGVVVMPQATASGRLIHAQNWDWKRECAETAVVLKVRRDDGPDLMTFTEAGALGRCGFNAVGIAITANYLQSDRDYRQAGVPLALIRRKVLENEHLALAMRAVYSTRKSAANNMIVSHREGVAIDFECAPDETFQVHPQNNGLLVHANHFVSPVALGKLKDTGIAETPDSLYRDIRVRDLLQPHIGRITFDTVKDALFDEFAYPWSVCRPPRRNLSNNLSATVAMILMEPASGLMQAAPLPSLNREFTEYRLEIDEIGRAAFERSAAAGAA